MSILILSATSGIAQACVNRFLQRGERLILAARRTEGLPVDDRVQTLVYSAEADLASAEAAAAFWRKCVALAAEQQETIDGILIAQGFLPSGDRKRWPTEVGQCLFLNLTSVAYFLEAVASELEAQPIRPKRWIAVITSVAGDRGRFSNYPYGAAKAGLDAYLSGLRARLCSLKVQVLTVKPGLVQTKMIAGRPQEKSFSVVPPEKIARDIEWAIRRRQDVLYTPYRWVWMMRLVRWLPEWIFKRLRF